MQGRHARQKWTGIVVMQGNPVLMSTVNHPTNCSMQCFSKVMIACKNVSTAVAASCAPFMKSTRDRAKTPSSSSYTGVEACAAGRHATAVLKAALLC